MGLLSETAQFFLIIRHLEHKLLVYIRVCTDRGKVTRQMIE